MTISRDLLSICIATMNRGSYIGATLESIISQAGDGVEIVIVDGGSTDETPQIVTTFQHRFPRLRYFRLDAPGGVDRDYCRAIEQATGEYCWLFTDDDILLPGAIDAVLAQLTRRPGLVIVNGEVRTADLSRELEQRCLRMAANRSYGMADSEQLFIDVAAYLSFIGCVVIKRSIWDEREKERYVGTVFVHVGTIFQAPIPDEVIVLAEPGISIRYGNSLWTPRSFEISLFKWPDLIWSLSGFSDAAKRRVTAREPWDSLTALLIYRARGSFSMREYRMFLADRMGSKSRRFAAQMIARLPGFPLNVSLVAYFSALGRFYSQPRIRLVDLQTSRFHVRQIGGRLAALCRLAG